MLAVASPVQLLLVFDEIIVGVRDDKQHMGHDHVMIILAFSLWAEFAFTSGRLDGH